MDDNQKEKVNFLLKKNEFVKSLVFLKNKQEVINFFNNENLGLVDSDFDQLCKIIKISLSELSKDVETKVSGGGVLSWIVTHPIKSVALFNAAVLLTGVSTSEIRAAVVNSKNKAAGLKDKAFGPISYLHSKFKGNE